MVAVTDAESNAEEEELFWLDQQSTHTLFLLPLQTRGLEELLCVLASSLLDSNTFSTKSTALAKRHGDFRVNAGTHEGLFSPL